MIKYDTANSISIPFPVFAATYWARSATSIGLDVIFGKLDSELGSQSRRVSTELARDLPWLLPFSMFIPSGKKYTFVNSSTNNSNNI